ncbi:TolC family protein [Mariprofundus ferrooxydans]|uniref:TolC family protein n=1 Tax=Mariprofundus ferrooxydans TaxID=314344 RepID=UPI00143107F3|nr:TolC family protein [Mariprofundus ferrooxydans]
MKTLFYCTIIAATTMATTCSAIASDSMSLKQIVTVVLKNHPDLQVSRIDTAIAETGKQRIQGMLDPSVSASIIASEEKTPVSSDFQAAETRTGQITGGINKPLPNGDTVSANFAYSRISQAYNSPLAAQLSRFNPAYRNQINLSYRHPLLKGADRPDYHQSLTVADADIEAADMQRQQRAHQIILQVVNACFQLASDDINIRIAAQAVKRAKKLLAYQRSRERFGLIEKADRLQAEALLAARNTDLQRALSMRMNSQTSLNRMMLRSGEADLAVHLQTNEPASTPSMDDALNQAESKRPEMQLLTAQLQAAEARLAISRDADQMQLDLIAEAGSRALANNGATAAARGFTVKDHYAALSFELSDVLTRNSANADIRKAELQRERVAAERIRTHEQIKSDISAAITAIHAGRPMLVVARKQAIAEKRKFDAEMQRYREGRSDTATLVQFEGELRNAELNANLQALTLELAARQLSWARGTLRDELGLTDISAGQ